MTQPAAELPRALLERLTAVLESHGVREFAFTGGVAVGVWATPRQTRDLDLCGVLPPAELDRLLALRDGIRSGAGAMPDLVRYRDAVAGASSYRLEPELDVLAITPLYFVATKLEAFRGRGRGDYQESHDIEDLLTVIAGLDALGSQIETAASGFFLQGVPDCGTIPVHHLDRGCC